MFGFFGLFELLGLCAGLSYFFLSFLHSKNTKLTNLHLGVILAVFFVLNEMPINIKR